MTRTTINNGTTYQTRERRKEYHVATTVLTVPDISCAHCVHTVTEALTPIEGVQQVSVDLPSKQVRVEYDAARVGVDRMRKKLAEEDYPVSAVQN